MVQRKVPNKLGIQADHVKSEKLLENLIKPSPSQSQDGKNSGSDLKKKKKKSKSIKVSEMETLKSSPSKKNISQPGKRLWPVNLTTAAAITTQKQSPNYMKSTSSSDARKESSQARRHSTSSRICSAAGNKPAKTLTRTSSWELVRTLTKSPIFKPARASVKKCSKVALCADMNTQRATCSSTLKDSKFPNYLMLSPGGTEYEGTSAMKVCPYTYCSLNGHRHAPLPPLKLFLSARRRSLKAQKSMKLGALSPRKAKQPFDEIKEINTGLLISDDKPARKEEDLGISGVDIFIEIYTESQEHDADAIGESTNVDDEGGIEFFAEFEDIWPSLVSSDDAAVEHEDEKQVAKSLSDESLESEMDSNEILGQEMDVAKGFLEEQIVEDADESTLGSFCRKSLFEAEHCASIGVDDIISETTDMEREESQFSGSAYDYPANYSIKTEEESDDDVPAAISEIGNPELQDEPAVMSEDIVSNCEEEILADEVLLEVFDNESACLEEQFTEGDSEQDGINHYLETQEQSQASDSSSCDQIPSSEDLIITVISSDLKDTTAAREEIQEKGVPGAENETRQAEPQTEDDETNCTINATDKALNTQPLQDDESNTCIGNKIQDAYQDLTETSQDETNEEQNGSQETEDSEAEQNVSTGEFKQEQKLPNVHSGDGMGETYHDIADSEDNRESDRAEALITTKNARQLSEQEQPNICNKQKWTTGSKRTIQDREDTRKFNPQEPNYLPVVPDSEGEKVDLKHQITDERKNTEEWMLDYALQRTVTELAPARKRKVALLVEAFETVLPLPTYDTHLKHNSAAFTPTRPIQACN